jgi:TolB-like protein/CRP-like cAMP-binding protein/tetratricopeptide (TPR) repeat protein
VAALVGLQKVELFNGLDSYSLREIAARCKWTRCERNQYVIRRDGTDRDVYFVISGVVRITAAAGRGRRVIFRDVPAGGVFGEHSAIDGHARIADVLALRESLLASMPPEAFRALLASHASVRERLLCSLTGSVRELAGRLLDLDAQPVQRRVWQELLRLARAAGVAANRARIESAPTHSDIASRVGTSREEVTREFSRLAEQGLLGREGRTLLLSDVSALERLAGDPRVEPDVAPAMPADEPQAMGGLPFPRQRRAILVAEMCDAVAMMERDEERTVERWRAFLTHAVSQTIPAHAGRGMLKVPADGLIAEFADGAQAVRCAFELNADLARFNTRRIASVLALRAGIHLADVIIEAFNVLGDGVNVAAGLAGLANPGETVASAEVRDQLTGGVEASIEDLGEQLLRGRGRAVRAFRVWPASRTPLARPDDVARTHGRPSIAVIPFRVLSAESRYEMLGDGLAEEIIAALSRVADFFVVSRLSSMAFRRLTLTPQSMGELLGVQYVVSGSLQIVGRRALLLAELADVRAGRVVWNERVEGDLVDMFAMQAELSRAVIGQVAPSIRSVELRRARITSLDQLDAFGLLLRGIDLTHRTSRDDFARAPQVLEASIERDPTSPLPYAWLAKWHVFRKVLGASPDAQSDARRAPAFAGQALERDPGDAVALAVDALVSAWMKHDLDMTEHRVAQALAANANEPLAWLLQAYAHSWRERGAEALQAAEHARSLSPLDPLMYLFAHATGLANLVAGRYEQAIELSKQSVRANRLHMPALRVLAAAQVLSGDIAGGRQTVAAIREIEPALTVTWFRNNYPGRDSAQGRAFAAALQSAGLPP